MELGQSGPLQVGQEYLAQEAVISCAKNNCLVKMQHMVVRVARAIVHSE